MAIFDKIIDNIIGNIFTIILIIEVIHIFIISPKREHEKEMKTLELIFKDKKEEGENNE